MPPGQGRRRAIAILITMIDTGVRLSELCNLHFENAHVEEGYLKVMGKGNKERVVPLGATAQNMPWLMLNREANLLAFYSMWTNPGDRQSP